MALVVVCGMWNVVAAAERDQSAYLAMRHASLSAGQQRMASSVRAMVGLVASPGASVANPLANRAVLPGQEGVVEVYVYTHILTQTEIQALQQHGVHIYATDPPSRTVYAAVAVKDLETVAALSFVRWISLPSWSLLHTGSVTSAADTVLRAAEARTTFGIDGSGVRIGIISDSLLNLQDSVASGDLPANVNILDTGDPGGTDEGRALAEIIHDLAPGATLLFHSGFPTSIDMVRAIRALVAAGAHIILDDIGFLDEPVFEDGDVARAVQDAITSGVVYVTATGNDATRHYRAAYQEFDPNDGNPNVNFHDFGGGDATMAIAIDPGDEFVAVLQWPDRFDGSANTADYDLLILDANGRASACNQEGISGFCASTDDQLNSTAPAPPVEIVFVNNTSNRTVTVTLLINRVAGAALPLVVNFNHGRLLEHNVASGSVHGHQCVREALSVGAIDVDDPGFDTIEAFSSRGPCEIFFPTYTVRTKPDIVAADGVRTSVPGFDPFFGTSPAAPHVAAIVALLIDAAGGPGVLSTTQLASVIRLSARDLGLPEHDNTFGHGAVDAVAVVQAVQALLAGRNSPPQSTIETPAADLVVTPGTAVTFQGACTDIESNGPVTVAWDFGAAAAMSPLQNPAAVVFPTPGVFPIAFTCVDANGVSDPSAATRTITVNQAPVSSIVSPSGDSTITVGSSVDFAGACGDDENNAPFAFLWFFGAGATIASSTQQNPQNVQFNTVGTSIVTFACTDALGLTDPLPALVQIRVVAGDSRDGGGDGGGGGGCALVGGGALSPTPILVACGNILLPVVALLIMRVWWYARRRQAKRGKRRCRAVAPGSHGQEKRAYGSVRDKACHPWSESVPYVPTHTRESCA
jgi:hypothetical protein